MLRVSELRQREVVNVVDGRRLGTIKDFDLDLEQGLIKAIMLPGPGRLLGFLWRNEDLEVSWEKVVKIGVDVILVEIRSFTSPKHTLEEPEMPFE